MGRAHHHRQARRERNRFPVTANHRSALGSARRRAPAHRAINATRARSIARRIATAVATRMLSRSISFEEAAPTPTAIDRCRIRVANRSRTSAESVLLSRNPRNGVPRKKHDGRGNHRSCQWAAAGFIDTDEEVLFRPGLPVRGRTSAEGSAPPWD